MSVPGNAEISITMKANNWAFGAVEGKPRNAGQLSQRPEGTEKARGGS